MGFDEERAAQAIRISIGPQTTKDQVLRFAEVWGRDYGRILSRMSERQG
jgi:cysteine desulfurase